MLLNCEQKHDYLHRKGEAVWEFWPCCFESVIMKQMVEKEKRKVSDLSGNQAQAEVQGGALGT